MGGRRSRCAVVVVAARRARGSAAGRASRRNRALVPRERLHVPDRIAGDLVLDGDNPYGHDYRDTGLERWYPAAAGRRPPAGRSRPLRILPRHRRSPPPRGAAARTFRRLPAARAARDPRTAPGCVSLSSARSNGDSRRHRTGGESARDQGGVVRDGRRAERPLPRSRLRARDALPLGLGGSLLGLAVLLKQFALVALPFLAVMFIVRGGSRTTAIRAGAAFGGVLLAGALPFLIADPGALGTTRSPTEPAPTGSSGTGSRHSSSGPADRRPLRPLPVHPPRAAHLGPGDGLARSGDSCARASSGWAAAGFSISMFVLLFLGRVFQTSYLVWPLAGIAVAYLLAAGEREAPADADARRRGRGLHDRSPARRAR